MEVKFPLTSEDYIVQLYEDTLKKNPNIKLTVIDHITSSTSIIMPIHKLVEICHSHDVLVVIDGAHCPGQILLNIPLYDADFYTVNFNKWMFTPKGCGILWKNPTRKYDWLKPLVTTFMYRSGRFMELMFAGTDDFSVYYSFVAAMQYFNGLGGLDAITEYNVDLRKQAVDHLVQLWGTRTLEVPASIQAPFMQCVKLPYIPGYGSTQKEAMRLDKTLSNFGVVCLTQCVQGELYVRVSVQVFNTLEDYKQLGDAVQQLRLIGKDDRQ